MLLEKKGKIVKLTDGNLWRVEKVMQGNTY